MMAELFIILPYPPDWLSPNKWTHPVHRGKAAKGYRRDCGWAAKDAALKAALRRPLPPPVVAEVTFIVPDNTRRDADNLMAMLKAAWDGCQDAGVLEDDSAAKFRPQLVEVRVEKGRRAVEVLLRSEGT